MTVAAATEPAPGLVGWIASTDHKRIGALTIATSLLFFAAGGVMALLMRAELAAPGLQVVSQDAYDQLFTMHGSTMIFLVLTPLALALGVYLVPLQIGASQIAGPRLTLLGYWLLVAGGLAMYLGFLTQHGAAKTGWTAFYPLSSDQAAPGTGMDLWILGVILVTTASTIHAATVLGTIVLRRAPGMTMLRLPVFSWAMVATCLMVVMSFPVLVATMALLFADRQGAGIFDSASGQIAYQHLFWFYGHPVVYVMFFPFLGAVAEVVATLSRRPFFGYRLTALSLLVFAALSMSVWAHHMFTTAQVPNEYFSLTSTLLLVPAGIEYFGLLGTLIGGSIVLRTPMLFALGFVLLFLLGGLSGIVVGSPPLDYHLHDGYFIVAHFHYTLFGGSVMGLFAGVYYWFPKATGVLLRESLGRLQALLLFAGGLLTFVPMFFLGYDGMRRRIADYPADAGFTGLNVVATVGAGVIAIGMLVFVVNLVVSLRRPRPAGEDPWQGQTLEWATSSPPPPGNFVRPLPPIRSHTPLLDLRVSRS
jgi:cytochrome c oxidase subunit I